MRVAAFLLVLAIFGFALQEAETPTSFSAELEFHILGGGISFVSRVDYLVLDHGSRLIRTTMDDQVLRGKDKDGYWLAADGKVIDLDSRGMGNDMLAVLMDQELARYVIDGLDPDKLVGLMHGKKKRNTTFATWRGTNIVGRPVDGYEDPLVREVFLNMNPELGTDGRKVLCKMTTGSLGRYVHMAMWQDKKRGFLLGVEADAGRILFYGHHKVDSYYVPSTAVLYRWGRALGTMTVRRLDLRPRLKVEHLDRPK